jgi:hypothetical protein
MPGRALLAGLALLAASLVATRLALVPPAPAPVTAAPASFSAERALPRLRRILDAAGPGVPHPAGSAAGVRVREAVVAELRQLGLEPRLDESITCNRYLSCTPVANVVARIRGRGAGPPVLVSAHHDSVPGGPGAGDDGSGVAVVLELARALRADPPAADVILLVDDAEESGLGGAVAFLQAPEAREVGAVVNLEARGTGGPSLLFETSGSSERVAQAFAAAPHPVGSSLLATVYGTIPNDTNLTVLHRLGGAGANLAFVDGGIRYHTPRDDLGHLDPATLQHQGENALALVHGLAGATSGGGQVVWFDLLGRWVVRFPVGWVLPLAVLALVLSIGSAARSIRRGDTGVGRVGLGFLALPLALGAAAVLGFGADRALGLHPLFRPWVATPGPLVAAFLASGLVGLALAPLLLAPRAGAVGLRSGSRIAVALVAVALAAQVPGASYLLLAPAFAWAVVGWLREGPAADLSALVAGSLVLLPPMWLLYPALGHAAGPAVAAALALAALPLVPLAAALSPGGRLAAVALPGVTAAVSLCAALLLPVADADAPERVVVYFHQDLDAGKAWILANADLGRLPPEVRRAAAWSPSAEQRLGWGALRPAFAVETGPLPLPGPQVEVLAASRSGDEVRWRGRIRSPRGAPEIQLAVPPSVTVKSLAMDGIPVPSPAPKLSRWYGGWWLFSFPSPPGGVEVALVASGAAPVEVVVADRSPDLPPAAAAVAAARPPWVVTQQEGDGTLFTRRVRLEAAPPPVR